MQSNNKIQIITIEQIRYVGNLHNINQKDKSVELRDIISYGTEDRDTGGKGVIPKSD